MGEIELSPRLLSCLPRESSRRIVWKDLLCRLQVESVMKLSGWYDSPEDLLTEMPASVAITRAEAAAVYNAADHLAASARRGAARASTIGFGGVALAAQAPDPPAPQATDWRARLAREVGPVRRATKRAKQALSAGTSMRTADSIELDAAVLNANRLAGVIGWNSPRLARMYQDGARRSRSTGFVAPSFREASECRSDFAHECPYYAGILSVGGCCWY